MTTNEDITIFNLRLDKAKRLEVFVPTTISGVSFYETASSNTSDGNRTENLDYKIRIPIGANFEDDRTYVSEDEYKKLSDEDALKHWTLQKGCYILTGAMFYERVWKWDDFDFRSGVITKDKILDMVSLIGSGKKFFSVVEYADNTKRGSNAVKHWRVGGA